MLIYSKCTLQQLQEVSRTLYRATVARVTN